MQLRFVLSGTLGWLLILVMFVLRQDSLTISSEFPQSKPFRPPLRGTFIPTVPSNELGIVGSSGPCTGISGIPDSSCISGVHRQSSRSKTMIVGKSTLPQDADEPTLVPFIVVLNANRVEKPV